MPINKTLGFKLFFVMLIAMPSYGQNYSNIISTVSENTPDSVIFQHCLDTIDKYVYLDSRKIKPYLSVCEEMLISSSELSNQHRFEYVIQLIYNGFNYNDPIAVLEIIEANRKMLDWEGVLPKQKNQFRYLDGFTLLELGEAEDAQETFYELLDLAKERKDTSLMAQSLSALGALFAMQKDYVNAEKYSLEFLEMISENQSVNKANFYVALVRLYLESDQLDKAEYYNQDALGLVESLGLIDLKVDFLLYKVSINLQKRRLDVALKAHREASAVAESIGNSNYQQLCRLSYAEILEFQNRYEEALSLYDQLIREAEKRDIALTKLLPYYQSGYKVADKKGDYEKAFQYLDKANQIADSLFVEEQKRKSQYLRIKFDAEQKDKENALLAARVLQKQSQNRFLYALTALFVVTTLLLIFAFLQKRNYNRLLEHEVRSRTSELKDANKSLHNLNEELNQFNKILSHDLKEPLRSIVGFSMLTMKELSATKRIRKNLVMEYLGYINRSGNQLNELIKDVSKFQSIGEPLPNQLKLVDVNSVIDAIIDSIQYLLQDKNVVVEFDNLPGIYSYDTLLFLGFKNLIENGIKFNKSPHPIIRIDYKRKDDLHVFLVQDNGIGIAPEFQKSIFGMFNRLHDRKAYQGSGLGLNIVKKIVRQLGGSISIISSDLDKGSLFQISLPDLKPNEVS